MVTPTPPKMQEYQPTPSEMQEYLPTPSKIQEYRLIPTPFALVSCVRLRTPPGSSNKGATISARPHRHLLLKQVAMTRPVPLLLRPLGYTLPHKLSLLPKS